MIGYNELIQRLKAIKEMGYIKTHRAGNTGIGKTLEDLLGIEENNIPSPNAAMIELKSARKNAKSMLTLFTKSPLSPKANSILLERFGYEQHEVIREKNYIPLLMRENLIHLKGNLALRLT